MNERMHRYLEGELQREELTPEELEEVAQCEHFIRNTRQVHMSMSAPDLTERIMAELPAGPPVKNPVPSHARKVLSQFIQDSLGWFWTPRSMTIRPLYGLVAVAVFFFIVALPNVTPRQIPPKQNIAGSSVDGQHPATQVFVQFRLDAPQASSVRLAGGFTGWKPTYALQEVTTGVWSILIPLEPGVHDYAFVVDGTRWVVDPTAPTVDDGFGGVNSRLSVLLPNANSRL
jgi:Glycogen recognition site of AMP-activated protein kinase